MFKKIKSLLGSDKKTSPINVTITLNARLQPMRRAELEDAIAEIFDDSIEITGGGTGLDPDTGEVSFCDIALTCHDFSSDTIDAITAGVSAIFAPKGSFMTVHDDEVTKSPFGNLEGLALYTNGTDLADEVYANCDSNHVLEECDRLLGDAGDVHSYWEGNTENGYYMYGLNFNEMKKRISKFIAEYPLCQKCRVVQIA